MNDNDCNGVVVYEDDGGDGVDEYTDGNGVVIVFDVEVRDDNDANGVVFVIFPYRDVIQPLYSNRW